MPEAPAATPVLSTIRMSAPLPLPRARSSRARWYPVLRPWTPAPTIRYLVWGGRVIVASLRVRRALQLGGVVAVVPPEAGISSEGIVLRHIRRVPAGLGTAPQRFRHRPHVVRRAAAADPNVADPEVVGRSGKRRHFVAGARERIEGNGERARRRQAVTGRVAQRLKRRGLRCRPVWHGQPGDVTRDGVA